LNKDLFSSTPVLSIRTFLLKKSKIYSTFLAGTPTSGDVLDPQVRAPLSGTGPPSPPRHNPGVGGAGEGPSAADFGGWDGRDETAAAAHAAQAAEESAPAAAQAEKGRRERGGQFPGNVLCGSGSAFILP
jgi:hypothetical protein